MRTLLLSACLSFLSSILFAQVPQAIKYQEMTLDSERSVLANANVTLSIDSGTGGMNYSEMQILKTIYVELHNAPYVVPSGKDLFITYASNWEVFGQNIYANELPFDWYLKNYSPLILSSGDSISFRPARIDEMNLTIKGYLK